MEPRPQYWMRIKQLLNPLPSPIRVTQVYNKLVLYFVVSSFTARTFSLVSFCLSNNPFAICSVLLASCSAARSIDLICKLYYDQFHFLLTLPTIQPSHPLLAILGYTSPARCSPSALLQSASFNPLHLYILMYILYTVLYTFP